MSHELDEMDEGVVVIYLAIYSLYISFAIDASSEKLHLTRCLQVIAVY
jgi:hypothetical protein